MAPTYINATIRTTSTSTGRSILLNNVGTTDDFRVYYTGRIEQYGATADAIFVDLTTDVKKLFLKDTYIYVDGTGDAIDGQAGRVVYTFGVGSNASVNANITETKLDGVGVVTNASGF